MRINGHAHVAISVESPLDAAIRRHDARRSRYEKQYTGSPERGQLHVLLDQMFDLGGREAIPKVQHQGRVCRLVGRFGGFVDLCVAYNGGSTRNA